MKREAKSIIDLKNISSISNHYRIGKNQINRRRDRQEYSLAKIINSIRMLSINIIKNLRRKILIGEIRKTTTSVLGLELTPT